MKYHFCFLTHLNIKYKNKLLFYSEVNESEGKRESRKLLMVKSNSFFHEKFLTAFEMVKTLKNVALFDETRKRKNKA